MYIMERIVPSRLDEPFGGAKLCAILLLVSPCSIDCTSHLNGARFPAGSRVESIKKLPFIFRWDGRTERIELIQRGCRVVHALDGTGLKVRSFFLFFSFFFSLTLIDDRGGSTKEKERWDFWRGFCGERSITRDWLGL